MGTAPLGIMDDLEDDGKSLCGMCGKRKRCENPNYPGKGYLTGLCKKCLLVDKKYGPINNPKR